MASRNPFVVIKAVSAPLRSIRAFVKRVAKATGVETGSAGGEADERRLYIAPKLKPFEGVANYKIGDTNVGRVAGTSRASQRIEIGKKLFVMLVVSVVWKLVDCAVFPSPTWMTVRQPVDRFICLRLAAFQRPNLAATQQQNMPKRTIKPWNSIASQ